MFNVRLAGEMAVHLDVAGDVFDGVLKTPPPPPPPYSKPSYAHEPSINFFISIGRLDMDYFEFVFIGNMHCC